MPYYRIDNTDYKTWLNQIIWISDCEKGARVYALLEFYEYITGFLKKKGYTMDRRWMNTNSNPLLSWIYRISVEEIARSNYNKAVFIPPIIHRHSLEDYDYFYHIIDCQVIRDCMDEWSDVEDLNSSSRVGYRVRNEIQDFIYHFINLESSKQGHLITRFWDNSDSDSDDNKPKNDIYLRDVGEGFHGGKGSKV